MPRISVLLVVFLIALVLGSGCAAIPFVTSSTQNQPVKLELTNSANQTQTFEVFVVEAGVTVKTRLNDGRTGSWTVGQGLRTVSTSGEYYCQTT